MCGFILSNLTGADLDLANRYVGRRGPDRTTTIEIDGVTFLHNVLSITGAITPQPFTDERFACVYNGEIYNHTEFGHFSSDGHCLLPALVERGKHFVNHLDGEFAVVILDRVRRKLWLYTDVFGTKPLHYGVSGREFAVASYASAITAMGFRGACRVPANTLVEIDITSGRVSRESELFKFDLDQHKDGFKDWEAAYRESIAKRTQDTREQIFIGLSSGYDSGAIACELMDQGVAFKSFSLLGVEDEPVLRERLRIVSKRAEVELIPPAPSDVQRTADYVRTEIEPIQLQIRSAGTGHVESPWLYQDGGAVGLCLICERAIAEGRKIYLSGQGADEIFADYGFGGERFYPHSTFGGRFPEDLGEIFPWASFYGSTQEAYLTKEEYVAGSFEIETRYPFLDKQVVQEFLSLSQELKNQCYKSVLDQYLRKRGFPTAYARKIGFVPA